MVLAVVDVDAHVLQREAGERARGEHRLHALLHGGNERRGDGAALHRVDELEAAATRQRLDLEVDLAELAGAAGLLLVPVVPFGRGGDGLAIRDARRARGDFELELARHALQHRAQVQVAQAPQHGLVQVGLLELQRRVLGDHAGEHVGDAALVAAPLGLDRDAVHRRRELERLHVDLVLVVRVVQHAVELDLVDLGHGRQVARHRAVDLDVLASLQHEQVADLERLAAVADEELRVLRDRALVHAEDAELADERVHHDLEHVREHVLGRIGLRVELGRGLALALGEQRRVALGGVGQELVEHLQQLRHARAGARRHEAHGYQVPFAQRLLERRVQLLRLDLALLEVDRHQLLVDLDDLVDQRAVRGLDRREVGVAGRVEEAVDDALAAICRQVDRQALLAERRLDPREHRGQVDVVGVDLVDDHDAAQLAPARPLHHPRRDHLHAGLRVDDDGGRLDRVERADRLPDEVGEARGVDDVHARAAGLAVEQRRAQRVQVLLLQRIEVADGGPALDAAGRRQRSGLDQKRLGQRGLTRRALAHQGYGTNVFRGVVRHADPSRCIASFYDLRGGRPCCDAKSGVVARTGRPGAPAARRRRQKGGESRARPARAGGC